MVSGVESLSAAAVEPDGGIIEVGGFPVQATAIRLRPDGTPDTGFGTRVLAGPGGTADVYTVAIQADGKILVAGSADMGNTFDMGVWRLLPTGAPDASFGTDGFASYGSPFETDGAYAVAQDLQGRVVVAGYTGINDDMLVVRFTSTGVPDTTFNSVGGVGVPAFQISSPGGAAAEAMAIQNDGRILVTGDDGFASGMPVYRIIPGDATTSGIAVFDPEFGVEGLTVVPGVGNGARGLSLQPDGSIVAVGSGSSIGGGDPIAVRLTPAGSVDDQYGSATGVHLHIAGSGGGAATAVATIPSGGVAISGTASIDGTGRVFVARLDDRGNPDTGMGPDGVKLLDPSDTRIDGVAVQPDGKIVTAGTTGGFPGEPDSAGVVYRLQGGSTPPPPPPRTATCAGRSATIVGTWKADRLTGTPHRDVIAGLGGADTIKGLGKGDVICGGRGNDHIIGGIGRDHVYGGAGRDTLLGGVGRDSLTGGPGRDTLAGRRGSDLLAGGSGSDRLSGGPGADRLYGRAGRDTLVGGHGHDILKGGAGRDVLKP